jgi:hypothetical protein
MSDMKLIMETWKRFEESSVLKNQAVPAIFHQ